MTGVTIKQFDKRTAVSFKKAVERRLQEIGEEFGVSMEIGKIQMNSRSSMSMVLNTSIGSEVRLEDTPSGKLFLDFCEAHGIHKAALGATVRINRSLFRVIGWNPNARKYCVEAEQVGTGKVYRLTPQDVRAQTADLAKKAEDAKARGDWQHTAGGNW